MTERGAAILEATIREFIERGVPVSSTFLYENCDFGIKPAMIRAELAALTDEGYLEQLYHSSGRTPSDRGYEFFANRLLAQKTQTRSERLFELFQEELWDEFLSLTARRLGSMVALASEEEFPVQTSGLLRLIKHLDWESRERIMDVIEDVEHIEDRLEEWTDLEDDEDFLRIFIGKKSPVTRSDSLSVIIGNYHTPHRHVILCAIGPKHMNYRKATHVFKGLKTRI